MAMALTQAPRTGALAPMGVGAARLFFKEILKALLCSAGAGYNASTGLPISMANGASARGGLEKRRAYPLAALLIGCVFAMKCGAKPGVCYNLACGMVVMQRLEFYSRSYYAII